MRSRDREWRWASQKEGYRDTKNRRGGRATSEQRVSSISLFENCWVFRGLKQRRGGETGQGERWRFRPLNPLLWRGAEQWWGEARTSFPHGWTRAVFSLTTHNRILLAKLTVIHLVKNYPWEIFSFGTYPKSVSKWKFSNPAHAIQAYKRLALNSTHSSNDQSLYSKGRNHHCVVNR